MIRFRIPLFVLFVACATPRAAASEVEITRTYKYADTIDLGDIDADHVVKAWREFDAAAGAGKKAITVRIDSAGGSIELGKKWIQMITDIKKAKGVHVDCIVDGDAYSMAAVILESPVCDQRLATPAATFLFHNGSGGAEGTVNDITHGADILEAANTALACLIAPRLGLTPEQYRARIATKAWVLAVPEALAAHVIDAVVSSEDIAPPAEG